MKNNKTILITGASGFVGLNLQDYLKVFHEINPLSVRYVPNQKFDLKGYAIIHLAGKAHDMKDVSSPAEYYESNFELTKQLYDSFLNSGVSVFVFMSTIKAVGDDIEGVLDEETTANPTTHYGISKRKAENYILSKAIPLGKSVYILRPCMIHGAGNKGNLNLLHDFVARGIPYPLGAFKNSRSFLSIENLCFVINELLNQKDIPSGIYQIADDLSLSTNKVIELLGDSLGKKSRVWNVPPSWIRGVALFGDYINLPLTTERLHKLTDNYVVGNHKILGVIGKSLPISSADGLAKTFESFNNKTEM